MGNVPNYQVGCVIQNRKLCSILFILFFFFLIIKTFFILASNSGGAVQGTSTTTTTTTIIQTQQAPNSQPTVLSTNLQQRLARVSEQFTTTATGI